MLAHLGIVFNQANSEDKSFWAKSGNHPVSADWNLFESLLRRKTKQSILQD